MTKRRNKPTNPQGAREMRTALALELHTEMSVPDPNGATTKTGKPRQIRIKKLRLVQRALVNAGIKGDVSAIREINDRMDGKVAQVVKGEVGAPPIVHEHTGKVEGAVKHDYSSLSDDALSRLHAEKVGPSRSG